MAFNTNDKICVVRTQTAVAGTGRLIALPAAFDGNRTASAVLEITVGAGA